MNFSLKNICKKIAASCGSMSCSGLPRTSFALVLAAFVFAGCNGLGSDANSLAPLLWGGTPAVIAGSVETGYVKLVSARAGNKKISASVLPEAASPESFSDFVLYMRGDTADAVYSPIASAPTLAELSEQIIEAPVGERFFRLTAKRGGASFMGETAAILQKGATTPLSFILTAEAGAKGGVEVKVDFLGQAASASYRLFIIGSTGTSGETVAEGDADFVCSDGAGSAGVSVPNVDAGTYELMISFYGDEGRSIPLNAYAEIVRVEAGLTSRAERNIDLNDLYKITYHNLPQGWSVAEWETDSSLPMNYSRKSGAATGGTINLPDLSAAGLYFAGYYSDAGFTVTKSQIDVSEARDLDIYPLFTDTIYVSEDGENIGYEHQMEGSPYVGMDWTIVISGNLNEEAATIISEGNAGSLTFRGATGAQSDSVSAANKGSVFVVDTAVPITFEKLTLKEGFSENGGGICLGDGTSGCVLAARVIVGSGIVINGNYASNCGGGIFACQDSVLTLTGDAVIGDTSITTPSSGDCANKAEYGGGIGIRAAKLIFDESFTGSVCGNYSGANGGGVYMESAVGFEMNGGLIKNNKAGGGLAGSGDGVYVSGDFSMSGSARVDASNTVPLYGALTITGPITGAKPVVTIYPGDGYSGRTTPVLKDNVGGSLVAQYNDKFAVVPEGGTTWYIGDDGKLTTTEPTSGGSGSGGSGGGGGTSGSVTLYVKNGGTGDGSSEASAFGTLAEAASYIGNQADYSDPNNVPDSETDYIIKVIGNLSGEQSLSWWEHDPITIKEAKSITIEGATSVDINGIPQDGFTGIGEDDTGKCSLEIHSDGINVTLKNIRITGYKTGLCVGDAYIDPDNTDDVFTKVANVILDSGVLITGVQCNHTDSKIGGGVTVKPLSKLYMKSGAKIISNESYSSGGAVNINDGAYFYMQGGEISGNTLQVGAGGSGVYVGPSSYFAMSGDAKVASDNDVYLDEKDANYAKITIASTLTAESPVATITPYRNNSPSYDLTKAYLAVTSDSGTSLPAEHSKFAVTPITKIVGSQIVDVNYIVNESGMLQEVSSGGGGIVVTSNAGGSGMASILSGSAAVTIELRNNDEAIDFTKLKIKINTTVYDADALRTNGWRVAGESNSENYYKFSIDSSLTSTGTVIEIHYDGAVIETLNVMRNGNTG